MVPKLPPEPPEYTWSQGIPGPPALPGEPEVPWPPGGGWPCAPCKSNMAALSVWGRLTLGRGRTGRATQIEEPQGEAGGERPQGGGGGMHNMEGNRPRQPPIREPFLLLTASQDSQPSCPQPPISTPGFQPLTKAPLPPGVPCQELWAASTPC